MSQYKTREGFNEKIKHLVKESKEAKTEEQKEDVLL
jgi:hypothetical protein